MKFKRFLSVGLAACLTLAFASTAFAAPSKTTNNQTTTAVTKTTNSVISPDFASPDPPAPGEHYGASYQVCAEPSLNVRSGPASYYPAVGILDYGTFVKVYTVTTDYWAQIMDANSSQWVSGYYLTQQLI